MTLVVNIGYTVIHAYLRKQKMKRKLKSSDVSYNPKTDEYTIEDNLYFVGTVYGVPVYCERHDYGLHLKIQHYLGKRL